MSRSAVPVFLALLPGAVGIISSTGNGDTMEYRELTPEEERVIVHGGTEPPFSGEYVNHRADGTYHCRRCGAPLYRSGSKFDSGCGWPSFDDELPGAVTRRPDRDRVRTEILCSACEAHLGHVFLGEGFTPRNVRHCVNSVSLEFRPARQLETAVFAGGCFWGIDSFFRGVAGVAGVTSGYTGGYMESPTYREVCSGETGHAEAVEVVFDPSVVSFEELAKAFFEIHDPTTPNRQGLDVGSQYRSAVFTTSREQREVIDRLIGILREKGLDVVTEVLPLEVFWPGEEYHQDYYTKNGARSLCTPRVSRFD